MTGYISLPGRASVPAPADVATYLLHNGWVHEATSARWAEYRRARDGVSIEVPQQVAADDYPRVVGTLLEDLAHLEDRSPAEVLRDIKAAGIDLIRLAIDSPVTRDGRIPVEAGRRVYEAARNLMLSAACSVIDPRPVFANRKPDEAMKLLERVRFGQTEIGSFVLSMECSIAPQLQRSFFVPYVGDDVHDPDAPLERRASTKLAQALQGAVAAARESSASGKLEPFAERSGIGVSANLCDGVAEVIEATTADSVIASFSFAARRPLAADVPRKVLFSPDTAPILREASARLREQASYPETDIVGPVVRLESGDAAHGGEAVLKVSIEGRFRSVRVALESAMYARAIEAHKNHLIVRCVGELARDGRSLVLRNVHDFSPESDDS